MADNPKSLVDYIGDLKSQGASDKEIRNSYNRYIEIKARTNKIPLHGKFELTPFCNLDCKMCYVHLDSKQFQKSDLIPADTWKKVINDARQAGMIYSTLTGGECLTYPAFDDIYLYLHNRGIIPCIMTNGLLMDQERIKFLKKFPPYLIQITLYGSSDDAYERVTGHRVFHTIYHNLEMLRESQLKVRLTITPSSFMQEDIQLLLETAQSLRIPYGINANLIEPRENTGRHLEDLEIGQYIEIYRIWKDLRQEKLVSIDSAELPIENMEGDKSFGLQCGAGSSSFTIQYNGKMSPCPSLGDVTTNPLQEGFLQAWHKLNKLVKEYPIPCECAECVYRDCCLLCPAIHNNAHNPGHRDPRICERTKWLIREGFIQLPEKNKGSQ